MIRRCDTSRTGSIYLITLITVAAIVAMILIGMELRQSSNESSRLIQEMSESSTGLMSAAEYSLQKIANDNKWNSTAQTGVVFSKITVGDSQIRASVLDADTDALPIDTTTNYQITVQSTLETTDASASFDISMTKYDYLGLLNTLGAAHYWPLNEDPDSPKAIDFLPENNDGTYLVPAAAGASTNDEGAQVPVFDDANDQIEIPWAGTFKARNGSVSMWIKATSQSSLSTRGILGILYKSGGKPTLAVNTRNGDLSAFVDDSGSYSYSDTASSSSGIVTLNTWHHVTVTWGVSGLTIYLDGVEVAKNASNTMGVDSAKQSKGGEQPLNVGSGYIVIFSTIDIGFKGSLAHVVYFTAQPKPDQVAELAAIRPDKINMALVDGSWKQIFK